MQLPLLPVPPLQVANAMAAKVKLLQRELKTLKADLAFSKERCAQLEEENRQLRDGNHDADEDMVRAQLDPVSLLLHSAVRWRVLLS